MEIRKLKEELKSVKEELQESRNNKNSKQLDNNIKKDTTPALANPLLLAFSNIVISSQSTK